MATERDAAVRRRRFEAAGTSSRLVEAGPEDASDRGRLRPRQPGVVRRLGAAGRRRSAATGTRAARLRPARLRRDDRAAPASSTRCPATRPSSTRRWRRSGSSASTSSCTTSAGRSGSPGRPTTPTRWPRHPDRHRHPARLQVASAGADLAHPGARRALPGDDDAPRLPPARQPQRAARACPARSSNGCTTTTTGARSGRC